MRAASRESFAAARERLDQLALGADPARLRTTADELLAVAGLLRAQPRLRRGLSGPARSGPGGGAGLRGLPACEGGGWGAGLCQSPVGGRPPSPSGLLAGCEQLGVQALLAVAEVDGTLADVEDELFRFGQVVSGHPVLASALGDRSVPVSRRAELADELLAGKALEVTRA